MIEKDNIQELFSKAFENQTSAVRPELWAGVQAKMAAAGVASTATVAAKGLSALTKWLIGSAAVGTVGVVTTVIALNSSEESANKKADSPKEMAQNISVTSPEESKTEQALKKENTYAANKPEVPNSTGPFEDIPQETNQYSKEFKEGNNPIVVIPEQPKVEKGKPEEKTSAAESSKRETAEKKEQKDPKKGISSSENKGNESVRNAEEIHEAVKEENTVKIAEFPNIFTPDGDHLNDTYIVKIDHITDFKMTVVDQKNQPLFQTNDPNEGWDGKVAGEDAKPGSYAVFIDGKDLNGKPFHKAQLIQLVR